MKCKLMKVHIVVIPGDYSRAFAQVFLDKGDAKAYLAEQDVHDREFGYIKTEELEVKS